MNPKRLVASFLFAVLLAACSIVAPSPTPAELSPPTPSATPAPSSDPTAVAPAKAKPGASISPTTPASGLAVTWHHDLICRENDPSGCELHLYNANGRELPGSPVPLAGWCSQDNVAFDIAKALYVACVTGDGLTVISSFGATGSAQPGWPVEAEGQAGPERALFVGPDHTVFVGTRKRADGSGLTIHAFGPDGRPRSGWPRTLPGAVPGFTLALDGTVVGWWYEDLRPDTLDTQAARTKYTMIGPNGETLPGRWPITSIGTATSPVVTTDGSIFYTSETGKVWGHDLRGRIIDGWPHPLAYRAAPELRPDGRLMFILGGFEHGDGSTSDADVIVLTTAGRMGRGWPYRSSASLAGVQCDTDSYPYYPHALSADGTLYLAPWTEDQTEVVALDGRGGVVNGWPYRMAAGSRVVDLEIGRANQIVVTLGDCSSRAGCCNDGAGRQITLTPAGELAP